MFDDVEGLPLRWILPFYLTLGMSTMAGASRPGVVRSVVWGDAYSGASRGSAGR
jgi:hypothetical protein